MTREFKDFALDQFEVKEEGDARTVEGFASVFNNVDSWNDIVMPGAFAKSLKKGKSVPMLWQHDSGQVIGKWDTLEERDKGLYVKGRILPTSIGNDAYLLAKEGAISGMSIGYGPEKYETDHKTGIRKLLEVKLYEVSLVTFPANEKAQVTRVKSRPETIREFEEYLREAGFSQKDATTIALRGFKALSTQGEPDMGELTALREIARLFNQITV